jgi:hypothetical protein
MKYRPDRKELWFRFVVSLVGLALMAVAITRHGVQGIAWVEIVLFAGAFFGGSALWSALRLWRGDGR